jgi:F0F1-type ATP synthase assembly protein I
MKQGETEEPGDGEQQETTRRGGIAYAAGLTIFFAVLSFMGVGWLLDRWLGTRWLMVAGIILGAVVGFYEFIRIISQLNK